MKRVACYSFVHTTLQKYAHVGLKQNLLRSTTLDIIPRLLDNAAFVCVHVVGRFSEDFLELRGLRSWGFGLQAERMTIVLCAELWKKCKKQSKNRPFSTLSNFYFDFRPPGQDRGAKTRPQKEIECANPQGSPGGWSGLELTHTYC